MGYDVRLGSSICSTLKSTYSRLIVPFEHYINKTQMTEEEILHSLTSNPSNTSFMRPDSALPNTPKDTTGADSLATPNTSDEIYNARRTVVIETNEKVRTASDKLNEALNAGPNSSKLVFRSCRIFIKTYSDLSQERALQVSPLKKEKRKRFLAMFVASVIDPIERLHYS